MEKYTYNLYSCINMHLTVTNIIPSLLTPEKWYTQNQFVLAPLQISHACSASMVMLTQNNLLYSPGNVKFHTCNIGILTKIPPVAL